MADEVDHISQGTRILSITAKTFAKDAIRLAALELALVSVSRSTVVLKDE